MKREQNDDRDEKPLQASRWSGGDETGEENDVVRQLIRRNLDLRRTRVNDFDGSPRWLGVSDDSGEQHVVRRRGIPPERERDGGAGDEAKRGSQHSPVHSAATR